MIELIIKGELKCDDIITESQMIERFSVSKSPVREALIQLCYEDVLRSIPRCGYQIVQISPKNIHDLAELRCILELSSLQKLSEMLTPETIDYLRQMIYKAESRAEATEQEKWTAWTENGKFHLALTERAGNAQVTAALKRALSTCTRAYAQVYEESRSAVIFGDKENNHQRIVKALENHEFYAAHEYLKSDIMIMEQELLHGEFRD